MNAMQAVIIFLAFVVALVLVKRFSRAIITGLALVGAVAVVALLALAYVVLSNPELLDTGARILEVVQ
jgi:amino acid permease